MPIAPASHSSACGNAKKWPMERTASSRTRNSGRVSSRAARRLSERRDVARRRFVERRHERERERERAPDERLRDGDVVRHEQRPPQLWVRLTVREPPLLVQEALAPLGERQAPEGTSRSPATREAAWMSYCSVQRASVPCAREMAKRERSSATKTANTASAAGADMNAIADRHRDATADATATATSGA